MYNHWPRNPLRPSTIECRPAERKPKTQCTVKPGKSALYAFAESLRVAEHKPTRTADLGQLARPVSQKCRRQGKARCELMPLNEPIDRCSASFPSKTGFEQ